MSAPGSCPLCGQPLYGWISLPATGGRTGIGMPVEPGSPERVIDRCEECGLALERGLEVDLEAEWAAVCHAREDGSRAVSIPNRASLQAAIGVEGWAGIDLYPGSLLLTPRSLELLASRNGDTLEPIAWPPVGRTQAWMLGTLLNGLTFHTNFAREVRAGRLRPASARSRFAFFADALVTVLGAPLVALASFPLELVAALARRGGEMFARVRTTGGAADGR